MKTNPIPRPARLALSALLAAGFAQADVLFSDGFDSDSSAGWSVFTSQADTAATFGYDYSADGIPAAPNSAGTTLGVKFTANMVGPAGAGNAAGVSMSPKALTLSGDYVVRFDLWMNVNGPFPGGGVGSTELASVAVGLAGDGALVWSGAAPASAAWFGVTGEGGASQDFRAYEGTTLQAATSGVYAGGTETTVRDAGHAYYATAFPGGQTAPASQATDHAQQTGALSVGTIGFAWRDVAVEKTGTKVIWSIDGLPIATLDSTTAAISTEGTIAVGYFDPFDSISDNAALSFGIVDNVRVETTAIPEPPAFALTALGVSLLGLLRRPR